MLSWHNNPDLKAEVVQRMREHRRLDDLIQGDYQILYPGRASGYKGCAIGCTLPLQSNQDLFRRTDWHGLVERFYGIPQALGYLIDRTFESLPTHKMEHAAFAVDVIETIPVGVDLTPVIGILIDELKAAHPRKAKAISEWLTNEARYLQELAVETSPLGSSTYRSNTYWRWVRDRFLHHLRALEPAPEPEPVVPLVQTVEIPEPPSILIRQFVNN